MNHSFNVIKYAIDDDGVNFNGMLIVVCEWNLAGRADMIFVKTFTPPEFLGPKFYTKTRKLE